VADPVTDEVFGGQKDMPEPSGILEASPGRIRAYLAPGRYSYQVPAKDTRRTLLSSWEDLKMVDTPGTWAERISEVVDVMVLHVLEQALTERFGA
jgi:hypothetical protein